jgi:hypothetical protein
VEAGVTPLLNHDFEERIIGVLMAPVEVLLLLILVDFVEIAILLVLLRDIAVVSTIFVAIPRMVILAAFVVVPLFLRGSGLRYDGTDQCGAQHQCTQNQKPFHFVSLARGNRHFAGRSPD